MIQWQKVQEETFFNGVYTAKMYRPLFIPKKTVMVEFKPEYGLDRYAMDHLGSELFNYKLMDTNKVELCESLGDLSRLSKLKVPIE